MCQQAAEGVCWLHQLCDGHCGMQQSVTFRLSTSIQSALERVGSLPPRKTHPAASTTAWARNPTNYGPTCCLRHASSTGSCIMVHADVCTSPAHAGWPSVTVKSEWQSGAPACAHPKSLLHLQLHGLRHDSCLGCRCMHLATQPHLHLGCKTCRAAAS